VGSNQGIGACRKDTSVSNSVDTWMHQPETLNSALADCTVQASVGDICCEGHWDQQGSMWYGDGARYWDKRYLRSPDTNFDWLETYDHIREYVQRAAGPGSNPLVLNVGCGNSRLSQEMYNDGFSRIINIDISSVVIAQMAQANESLQGMEWLVMDVTDMSKFENDTFDIVIDKGMFDTLASMKAPSLMQPPEETLVTIARYLKEVCRVLRVGGSLICVSHAPPPAREPFFFIVVFRIRNPICRDASPILSTCRPWRLGSIGRR